MSAQKGYVENVDVRAGIERLQQYLDEFPVRLKELNEEELLHRPMEGKWSKKEILGHLVDSAVNNLKRFTEIQFLPQPYRVIPYNQVGLVIVNGYQELPLDHLLDLWRALNRQILFVVRNIPEERLEFPVDPQYETDELKTLGWVIADYVGHLEHHLRQIFDRERAK